MESRNYRQIEEKFRNKRDLHEYMKDKCKPISSFY